MVTSHRAVCMVVTAGLVHGTTHARPPFLVRVHTPFHRTTTLFARRSGCSTNYARKDLELDELFGEIDIPLENVGFSRGLGEENAESFDFKTAGLLNFLLTDDRSLILPPMSYNLDSDAIIFPYGKISSEIPSVDDKIDMIKSNEVVCSPQEHRRSSPPLLSELSGSTESTSQWTDFFDDLSVESDRGTTKKSMNMMNVGESTFRKLNSGLQHRVSKNPLESARGKKSSGNIDMGVLETLRQQIELQSQLQRQIQDQWKLQSELEKNSMRLRKMLEQQKEATRCLRPVQSSATLAKHGERFLI
ncbi:uncharacterized protein LOC144708606 isoform X2 [Wolffia australiana]